MTRATFVGSTRRTFGGRRRHAVLAAAFVGCLTAPAYAQQKRDDFIVRLDPDSFVLLTFDDVPEPVRLDDGAVALETDDPSCNPIPTTPCQFKINLVTLVLSSFSVGDFHLDTPIVSIGGPILSTKKGNTPTNS